MSQEQPTHSDWLRAKSRADTAAHSCTLEVLSGNLEGARRYAEESRVHNAEMQRISAVLAAEEAA